MISFPVIIVRQIGIYICLLGSTILLPIAIQDKLRR